jgi:hypothetical protein
MRNMFLLGSQLYNLKQTPKFVRHHSNVNRDMVSFLDWTVQTSRRRKKRGMKKKVIKLRQRLRLREIKKGPDRPEGPSV